MSSNTNDAFTSDYPTQNPERLKQRDMPHAVYQFLDKNGHWLYIGVTMNASNRFASHRQKEWWPQVAKTIVRYLPNKRRALDVERALIFKRQPLYNRGYALKSAVIKGLQPANDPNGELAQAYSENAQLRRELQSLREEVTQLRKQYNRVVGE